MTNERPSNQAFRIRRAVIWRIALVILGASLSGVPCNSGTEPAWSGPPMISEDGSTVIRLTGPVHAPGEVVDIGFFNPDGKQRAIVARRHGLINWAFSPDGYMLIWGTIIGRNGRFLSLYASNGRLRWEKLAPFTGRMDVAATGHRTAVEVGQSEGGVQRGKYVLLLNDAGSEVQRYSIGAEEWVRYLSFCGSDRFLVMTTTSEVLMFDAETLNVRWKTTERTEVVYTPGVIMSHDLSQMALLDGIQVKEKEETHLRFRVTLFDAKTGRIVKQKTLPEDFGKLRGKGFRYDRKRKSFVVETKERSYELSSGQ